MNFDNIAEVKTAFLLQEISYMSTIDVLSKQFGMYEEDAEIEVQSWEDEERRCDGNFHSRY